MVKAFFPVSEQDAQGIIKGQPFNERRLGVFKTKEDLLETRDKHPLCFQTHPLIVEIDVPEDSVRLYPDPKKFSFGPCSGATVTEICSIEIFEQKAVMSVI
jgi:hypothetical protein